MILTLKFYHNPKEKAHVTEELYKGLTMTHLYFIMLLSISISFAVCNENTSAEVIKSVKLNGFICTKQILLGCSYTECSGNLGTYPKPVLITIPERVDSLRLHFHGHILGTPTSKPYEGNLSSMTKAFGIQKSLCETSEVTVFPQSTGANTTYKGFFTSDNSYTQFFGDIQSILGNNLKDSPLHLSGHSGGGKFVAGALNAGIKTAKVSIFDGIYGSTTKDSLKAWYDQGNGKLIIGAVKDGAPDNYATQLRNEVGARFTSTKSTIKGTIYDVRKSDRFTHYTRAYSNTAHFNTVTEIWPSGN